MKKALLSICLLAAFGAHAQDSNSTSQSGSQAGSNSDATATGNINASQSNSASGSRADSGSTSGAVGNTVIFNPSSAGATAQGAGGIPTTRVINQQDGTTTQNSNMTATTRAEQILSGGATNTDNVKYSGQIDNNTSGGTNNTSANFSQANIHYSGTQTINNVPGIAMSGPASGPCTGNSGGLGLAGPGWGVGLNGSAVMADCRLRENARVLGMGMQSLDGAANPQEKGELTVLFMDAMRGLAAYNNTIIANEVKQEKK